MRIILKITICLSRTIAKSNLYISSDFISSRLLFRENQEDLWKHHNLQNRKA